jgi:hypothetical protein
MSSPPPDAHDIVGRGWAFPVRFHRASAQVAMAEGGDEITQSLTILFGTRPGERAMLPAYGCDLHRFVFRDATTGLLSELEDVVMRAIRAWEQRIDAEVEVRRSADTPGLVLIDIQFTIRRTSAKGSFVYPFNLRDSALPGPA